LLESLTASGQECRTDFSIGFHIGSSAIDPSFGENADHLSKVLSLLERIAHDSTLVLSEVTFSGSASPDGQAAFNKQLSADRMSALEMYVRDRVILPDSLVVRRSDGIAWRLLADLVRKSDMPHKEEALYVLQEVPEFVYDRRGRMTDSRKKQLMELQRGRTWHYMDEHFFGQLRNACTVVVTATVKPAPTVPEIRKALADSSAWPDLPEQQEPSDLPALSVQPDRKSIYLSLKTNLLYDLLLLPNVGAEFYLGKNWSLTADWIYGWWDADSRHRYWRAYGGELAVRKWFGKAAAAKPLTGHHLGVYGQLLTYDIEFGGKGQMAGKPGKPLWSQPSYAAGVEYGYSLPIAPRLDIDFSIGIGYLGGKYYNYRPIDDHYVWQSTSRRHWFGPTRAEISLVWLLGHGNRNEKKGGAK